MDDQNVAIRLKVFIDSEGLSYSQFADQCGIPRPSLSQILSGRNKKISDVIVGQIHKTFPNLSVLWLMFGEGPMLLPENNNVGFSQSDTQKSFPDGNLFSEAINFIDEDKGNVPQSNVKALTNPLKPTENSNYKEDKAVEKIAELQSQIDKLRKNPRKVSQITVYYDDSTFETFYPNS